MNTFHSLAFLAVAGLLSACGTTLPVRKSEKEIQAAILAITPIGTSKSETAKSIQKKIRPKRFRQDGSIFYAKITEIDRFPLPFFYFTWQQIDAQWWFTGDDYLFDVKVRKDVHGM